VQAPETQAVPPLALVQVVPQVPQLAVVLRGTSQPFETCPSQLP
jgi:hypothetical protein